MGEGCLQYSSNALTYKAVKTVNMNCFLQQDFLSFGLSRLRVLLLLSTSFDKFLLRQLSCSKFRFSLQYLPRDKETESLLLLVMITIYLFFNHTTHTTLRITYTKAKLSKKVSACAPSSPPDLEILHHEPKWPEENSQTIHTTFPASFLTSWPMTQSMHQSNEPGWQNYLPTNLHLSMGNRILYLK